MMSKDDSLLVQVAGLITVLRDAKFLSQELKSYVPEIFNEHAELIQMRSESNEANGFDL